MCEPLPSETGLTSRQCERSLSEASMSYRNYINTATDEEKAEALRGLSVTTPANPLHGRAALEAEQPAGRYREITKQKVVGASAGPYPRAAGPWHNNPDNAVEPPLGVDLNAVEPVGTPAEIKASLQPKGEGSGRTSK